MSDFWWGFSIGAVVLVILGNLAQWYWLPWLDKAIEEQKKKHHE